MAGQELVCSIVYRPKRSLIEGKISCRLSIDAYCARAVVASLRF